MNSSSSFSSSDTHFCFDAKTQKLLELTKSKDIQEKKVEEIISILNLKCPKLLEGLCKRRTRNVVSQLQFKCFPRDEVIFHQNDEPDAYYTVIRGAVSIYAQNSTALDENNTTCSSSLSHKEENLVHRSKYGKFLVQLPPGSGFGELSFNADGKHSKRSAGVVSDGSHGQSKVYSDDNREHEASDVAVLLLIPGTVYLKEMFGRDINKHQTKEKVDFLKSSFIFSVWSVDQLVFLSHEMRKLEYSSGSKIVNQGEKNENTWIIKNGTVQIFVEVERRRQLRPSNADKYLVNIATLSANDLFGIVEALEGSTKMRCSVKALSDVEVFVISSKALISFLPQVPRTRLMLQKVARNRVSWEELRIDFARKFPNIKLCLTPNFQKTLSDYHLSQEMALTDTEIKQRKKRSLVLFKCLRDARASYRMYLKTREDHPTRFVQKVTMHKILSWIDT